MKFSTGLGPIVTDSGVLDQRRGSLHFAGQQGGGALAERRIERGNVFLERSEIVAINVPGSSGSSRLQPHSQLPYLGDRIGEKPGNLGFQSARVDDLAQRCVGGQRQKVARDIKGPRLQRAVVALLLHVGRLRHLVLQRGEHGLENAVIAGEEVLDGFAIAVRGCGIGAEVRHVPAALSEILVSRGPFLPVPALLVDQHDGRKQ